MMSSSEPMAPSASLQRALSVLTKDMQSAILALGQSQLSGLEEIRVRANQPVQLCGAHGSAFLHSNKGLTHRAEEAISVDMGQLRDILQMLTRYSMYSVEDELKKGFITMPGGHRVGIAGRVVVDGNGYVKTMRDVTSLNIRIARAFPGVATPLRRFLYSKSDGRPLSTLILSPPQCGKTTLLRDLARQWSDNLIVRRSVPAKVTVVDERSEIAGCLDGVPQFQVGMCTDVLDGCPKAEGMLMAIRSLSPDIVVTDEIGRQDDVTAILDATHAGIAVVTSAHAATLSEWRQRPLMETLFESRAFSRFVVLSRKRGPGTVEAVLDEGGRLIS